MELDIPVSSTIPTTSTNPPQTKKKRNRKRKHNDIDDDASKPLIDAEIVLSTATAQSVEGRPPSKKPKNDASNWKISESVGGIFEDLLPVFSPDEEHILLAQRHSVRVYSTANSTLVRTCRVGNAKVCSFCLSSTSNKLYILLSDGKLQSWDWINGNKLKTWDLGAQVSDIAVSALSEDENAMDVVYTSEFRKGTGSITAHILEGSIPTAKVLYHSKNVVQAIRILNRGEYVVATTSSTVIVGKKTQNSAAEIKSLQYTFTALESQENISSFDARISNGNDNKNSSQGGLDIAVGLEDGSITAFYDVIPTSKKGQQTPLNQKLHWHRDLVGSVAWTPDGNYLLSGGRETVLVMWQLDTGAKTTLPHLTSSIESVVVSPKRTSYAIRLADNSVMILATADMVPTFNISSTSLPSKWTGQDKTLKTDPPKRRAPIARVEAQPPRVLMAVSSDTFRGSQKVGSYSNTILLSTPLSGLSTAVTRQALVDDNTTTIRQRPDGKQLVSPNVVLIEPSKDGRWLSTVDEWYPPLEDFLANSIDQDEALLKQAAATETNLTFWEWDERTETWIRSTRVPNPHADMEDTTQSTKIVLDVIAAPQGSSFWTIGLDGMVKEWSLRKRSTVGSRATTNATMQENVWRCVRSIPVPGVGSSFTKEIVSVRLAISKDSSILAVTMMDSNGSSIAVLAIKDSGPPSSLPSSLLSMQAPQKKITTAILNQYLIMADQQSLVVRNLINSEEWYEAKLSPEVISLEDQTLPHIAIDQERQLIAICIPRKSKRESKAKKSKIMIFSTTSKQPVTVLDHQPATTSLLFAQNKFYALTGAGEIYSISAGRSSDGFADAMEVDIIDEEIAVPVGKTSNLSDIFGSSQMKATAQGEQNTDAKQNGTTLKSIAFDDIPGLNLEQPFNLPKTSTIQMMSMMAIRA